MATYHIWSRASLAVLGMVLASVGAVPEPAGQALPLVTLWSEPEPASPRALLDRTVRVRLTGTVADAVRELVGRQNDWLVSAPGPQFAPPIEFALEGLPLWQALDRLRDAYGYDWGYTEGAVVCWPATEPRSPRNKPRPPQPTTVLLGNDKREPVVLGDLTPVGKALEEFDDHGFHFVFGLDDELKGWHVLGRISRVGQPGIEAVIAAMGAVEEGVCLHFAIKPGAAHRLDAALAWLRANPQPAPPDPNTPSLTPGLFRKRLISRLSSQQWLYVQMGGQTELAFRELPTDVAGLFVAAARETATCVTPAEQIDWAQPDKMKVEIRLQRPPPAVSTNPDDVHLMICGDVPLTNGRMLGF